MVAALGCALFSACGSSPADDEPDAPGDGDGPIDADPDAAIDAPPGTPIAVAVGYGQRRAHSFDGITWQLQEVRPDGGDDDDLFRGLTFGGGRFVAVGGSSVGLTAVSLDGVAWTPGGTARAWIGDVAWNGSVLVAAGGNGVRVRSTDGGATWIDDAGYQATHYRSVAASGAGVVVAVGHSYDAPSVGVITSTADGVTWNERRRAGATFGTVAFGAGTFVAAGEGGLVATSRDGASWTDRTVGTGAGAVVFTGGEFVLSRSSGIYRSPDGETWTPATTPSRNVAGYFGGAYLAVGWPLSISRSTDLSSWTPVFSPMGSGLTEMVTGVSP